jgi:hypothetical protein
MVREKERKRERERKMRNEDDDTAMALLGGLAMERGSATQHKR